MNNYEILAVTNWPPGYDAPVNPPQRLLANLEAAERAVDLAWQALSHWEKQTMEARNRAWLEHHRKNGWPDIPGYKKKMESTCLEARCERVRYPGSDYCLEHGAR